MDLSLYLKIIKFNFLIFFTYPLELGAFVLRYILRLLFILFFWSVVSQVGELSLDTNQLLGYFLLSTGISDLLMADNTNLGRTIRKSVKRNEISQILIKPVSLIQFYYAQTLGTVGVKMILAIISIVLGAFIIKPVSIVSYILFIVFMVEAFFIAYAYNLFEGALSLIFTEVSGIKNAMHHVTRVFSGQVVPFTFFNEGLRNILLLTPIPTMVFGPINALQQAEFTQEIIVQMLIGAVWSILLNFLVFKFWKKGLKTYDAAGN